MATAPGRPLEFVHPIVRAAVRNDLPAGERIAVHRRAAEILLSEGASPGRVGVHLLATDPGAAPWVVHVLREAAEAALARGAPDVEAVATLERAGADARAAGDGELSLRIDADLLAAEELDLARSLRSDRATGVALRALGLAEGGPRGEQLLGEAVAVLGRSPARLEYARALVDLGAAIRRGGRRTAARDPLAAGLDLAHR